MSNIRRLFVEKKDAFAVEAHGLLADLRNNLGMSNLTGMRIVNRYDVMGLSDEEFAMAFCHLTTELPEPVVKAFLGDPTPPAKLPFCQSTVAAFLNKHSPCLRPIVVPHCQYICHLIASLPPSRKTHRAFFKFWDIISHRWVRF